jgi:hypothetical protein
MKYISSLFSNYQNNLKQAVFPPALLLIYFASPLMAQWEQAGIIGKPYPYDFFDLLSDTTQNSIYLLGDFEETSQYHIPIYKYSKGRIKYLYRYNGAITRSSTYITGAIMRSDTLFLSMHNDLYINDSIPVVTMFGYVVNDSIIVSPDSSIGGLLPYKYEGCFGLGEYQGSIVIGINRTNNSNARGVIGYKDGYYFPLKDKFLTSENNSVFVRALQEYKGKLYVGGNFSNGTFGNDRNLQVYDGEKWSGIKGWQFPSFLLGDITSMAVYKGDLYIGGLFRKRDGGIADHIVRYDGTHFYDIKSGFDSPRHAGTVSNMKVHKGYLYVYGSFVQTYHEWPTNGIVRWDGSRWCRARGEFNGNISDIAFLNDTLFVGGGFTLDNGNPLKYFAKWTGSLDSLFFHCPPPVEQTIVDSYVGEEELTSNNPTNFRVYPNPAKDKVFVECPSNGAICRVYSTDGRYLSTIKLKKGTNPVAIKDFRQSLLLLSIQSEGEIYGFKVVVE